MPPHEWSWSRNVRQTQWVALYFLTLGFCLLQTLSFWSDLYTKKSYSLSQIHVVALSYHGHLGILGPMSPLRTLFSLSFVEPLCINPWIDGDYSYLLYWGWKLLVFCIICFSIVPGEYYMLVFSVSGIIYNLVIFITLLLVISVLVRVLVLIIKFHVSWSILEGWYKNN